MSGEEEKVVVEEDYNAMEGRIEGRGAARAGWAVRD